MHVPVAGQIDSPEGQLHCAVVRHAQVAEATARFNALHDEKDRRPIRRRAAK
jgi:hypothetical protein